MTRKRFLSWLGPRQIGGRYYRWLFNQQYEVLDITGGIYPHLSVRYEDGKVMDNYAGWTERDKIISQPKGTTKS